MAEEIKIGKDIESVREIIKDIDTLTGEVNKIKSEWTAYSMSVPSKEYGIDEIGFILNELLDTKYIYKKKGENLTIKGAQNSLRIGLFEKIKTDEEEKNEKTVNDDDRIKFIEKIKLLNTKIQDKKLKDTYNNINLANIKGLFNIDAAITPAASVVDATAPANTAIPVASDADSTPAAPAAATNHKTVTTFINDVKTRYDTSATAGQYTAEEKRKLQGYFSNSENSLQTILARVKTSQDLINTKVESNISKLIEISSKYAGVDTRIKKDVLEKLKPTDISKGSNIDIINMVNEFVLKFTEDYKIHSTLFIKQSNRGGARKKNIKGGAVLDRTFFDNLFKDSNTDSTTISKNIKDLKTIAEALYKGLSRFSNPESGDASKGEDSLFNKLFDDYMDTKEDDRKGEFIASTNLINSMKYNDVYPDEVLKINMRDKFVFVGVTLFLRIISLMIVELIINRKLVTRMDSAIFWYGVIMSSLLIIFVVLVNYDSYKLRIVFNYVNFHIGYSTFVSYILQLWVFGGMVYYIMLNINDSMISSATNDEERARLKHKVQVISMITWIFLTLGVLVM